MQDLSETIRVFSPELVFMDEIDDYDALQYIRRWRTYSEFMAVLSGKLNACSLVNGSVIMLGNDPYRNGLIELSEYNSEDKTLTVRGFSLLSILADRVTVPPSGKTHISVSGPVESIMHELVRQSAYSPENPNRKFPQLEMAPDQGRGIVMSYQSRYANLLDNLTELSAVSGLGPVIWLDFENRKMVFEVREGINRTKDQDTEFIKVFSPDFENVENRVLTLDDTNAKTTAYVAGQGEGVNRSLVIVGDDAEGMERREMSIDAGDVEDDNNLSDRGRTKLAEVQPVTSYSCEVVPNGYRTEWDLGDLVTTLDEEFGVEINERVTEVEEAYSAESVEIRPTFGIEKTVSNGSSGINSGEISLLAMYPVGSIYMTVNPANPGNLFGGTWAAWGAGKVPVGVDTSDTDFATSQKTGGAKTVNLNHLHTVNAHTHTTANFTLTTAHIPSHTHTINHALRWPMDGSGESFTGWGTGKGYYNSGIHDTGAVGSGQAHGHGNTGSSAPGTNAQLSTAQSIVQPYITCYMWLRTA